MNQPNTLPVRKVGAGLGGGILATPVLIWLWGLAIPDSPMPPEVGGALGAIVSFFFGYFVPGERIVHSGGQTFYALVPEDAVNKDKLKARIKQSQRGSF